MNPRSQHLILRGYGPLAGIVVVLLFLTMLVPSRPYPNVSWSGSPEPVPGSVPVDSTGGNGNATDPSTSTATGAGGGTTASGAGPGAHGGGGERVSTAARPSGPAGPGGSTPASPSGVGGRTGVAGPGGVVAGTDCSGGALQDANSPYSPPCLDWTGSDNGGVTSRGVTKDTIVVAMRDNPQGANKDSELSKKAKDKGLTDTEEDKVRTRDALLEYFNTHYQLYGRKVKLVTYKGRGDITKEFGGGGQEEANADALKVGREIGAFADLSAISQPYLDALVRQRVVAFGGLHLPRSYYQARAPYAWGQLVDCTTLVENAVDLMVKRFKPGAPAVRAGSAALRTKPRRFGVLVPDDPVYRQCFDEGRPRLKAAGIDIAKEINYALDFSKMQQEAPNIAAQLKQAGVTTVVLVTDPLLPYFLTGAATQQDYWPEWFVTGTALTDLDILGQFYDQDQWQFAYGQSFLSDIFQGKDSESYRAYKAVRPQDEPSVTRDTAYYPFLMLFIALQMAGPNLTPQTFQAGLFAYPPRTGGFGRWSFSPTDYTASDDAREIYWDRNALSAFNNKPGRYVTLNGGRRYRGSSWPDEPPPAPVPPAAAP